MHSSRVVLLAAPAAILLAATLAWTPMSARAQDGFRIESDLVTSACAACHFLDDQQRMSRISYLRKTPEGWQNTIRRMAALHGAELTPEVARGVVRYLSDAQGLAPDELRPGLYEVERRAGDQEYEADEEVEDTCIRCHSMGRVVTQRRTKDEWGLLLATHRALYPLVDGQAFRRSGPAPTEPGPDGAPPDTRHPMERAVDHLSRAFPLETPAWSAWSATMRAPRLAGTWLLTGYEPGKGAIYGTLTVEADPADPATYTTEARYTRAETRTSVTSIGQAFVYTGYQWRGRSGEGESELREVLTLERDQRTMSGRWFTGAYDEIGPDVTLRRVGTEPLLAGVHPKAAERGATTEVRLYGAALPASAAAADLDLGPGVRVVSVSAAGEGVLALRLEIAADAAPGRRDIFAFGASLPDGLVVHDGVDRIAVTPATGMARLGGAHFPKQLQVFDAFGYDDGPDGDPETADDLELGRVSVTWSLEEYSATLEDDDLGFVGAIGPDGTFTPAQDGPNPLRPGSRNNVGDVWAVATHGTGVRALRARAHLLVTVPLYFRFDPWREVGG